MIGNKYKKQDTGELLTSLKGAVVLVIILLPLSAFNMGRNVGEASLACDCSSPGAVFTAMIEQNLHSLLINGAAFLISGLALLLMFRILFPELKARSDGREQYNFAMRTMSSCPSIQERKLKSALKSAFSEQKGRDLDSKTLDSLVTEFREIKALCNELAIRTFEKNAASEKEIDQAFLPYPKLDLDLRRAWIQEAQFTQFR